jgi:LacI family transcriptional regulator
MEKLTIREIAKMAGVSTTVVSFVMNGKPGVNEDTRRRVQDVLDRTGFMPNLTSRRMILKKSFNISVIKRKDSSPFDNLFYFEIAQGLADASESRGYNLVFTSVPEKNGRLQLPEIVRRKDADGVVFLQDTDGEILLKLQSEGIPFVVADAHRGMDIIPSVSADYEEAAFTATRYLTDNGHREIAFISSSTVPEFYTQVFSGFRRALSGGGLSIPSGWIQMNAADEGSAAAAMRAILGLGKPPTAVFCATDLLAVGAMRFAMETGHRVPGDISFVGIDDILLSRYIQPALTTVGIDKANMGQIAFEILMKRMNGEDAKSRTVPSDRLIVRDSVRKL